MTSAAAAAAADLSFDDFVADAADEDDFVSADGELQHKMNSFQNSFIVVRLQQV